MRRRKRITEREWADGNKVRKCFEVRSINRQNSNANEWMNAWTNNWKCMKTDRINWAIRVKTVHNVWRKMLPSIFDACRTADRTDQKTDGKTELLPLEQAKDHRAAHSVHIGFLQVSCSKARLWDVLFKLFHPDGLINVSSGDPPCWRRKTATWTALWSFGHKRRLAVLVFHCRNQTAPEYLSRELQWAFYNEPRRRLLSASSQRL